MRAIEHGATGVGRRVAWFIHGNCSDPVSLRLQPERSITAGWIDIVARCRNCDDCLKHRARQWAARASVELDKSRLLGQNVWFGTFTLGPDARKACLRSIAGVSDPRERARNIVRAAGPEVAKYLKRVRKRVSPLRYMWVPELHQDGMVHWHAILHGGNWRQLARPWQQGFTKVNRVEGLREIRYVTKYLAKAKLGRVRASVGYGLRPQGHSEPKGAWENRLCIESQTDGVPTDLWIASIKAYLEGIGYVIS